MTSTREQFDTAVDACGDINALSRVLPPIYRQSSEADKLVLMNELKEFLKTKTGFWSESALAIARGSIEPKPMQLPANGSTSSSSSSAAAAPAAAKKPMSLLNMMRAQREAWWWSASAGADGEPDAKRQKAEGDELKCYVANLAYAVDDARLEKFFQHYVIKAASIKVMRTPIGKSKGA